MKDKLPVVGKRYKKRATGTEVEIIGIQKVSNGIDITLNPEYTGFNRWDFTEFLQSFEELPDSNPQEEPQDEIDKMYQLEVDIIRLESDLNIKKCMLRIMERNRVNKTPNPVDLEKGEVSEVDRALEELKREIALCGGGIKPAETEGERQIAGLFYYFLGEAQKLVNALEAEKARPKPEPAVDENEQAYYEAISKYPKGIKAHSFYPYEPCKCCSDPKAYAEYMSKPEPKIDMKEERVSIWKDVSELPKEKLTQGFVKDLSNHVDFGLMRKGLLEMEGDESVWPASNHKFLSITDFINSFEQMQKDIGELKRKST